MPYPKIDGLIPMKEAARIAGVSLSTLRRDADLGVYIKSKKSAKGWRWFDPAEIEEYRKVRAVQ